MKFEVLNNQKNFIYISLGKLKKLVLVTKVLRDFVITKDFDKLSRNFHEQWLKNFKVESFAT